MTGIAHAFSPWSKPLFRLKKSTGDKKLDRVFDKLRIMTSTPYRRDFIRTNKFTLSMTRGLELKFDYRVHPNKCRWLAIKLGWLDMCWIINERTLGPCKCRQRNPLTDKFEWDTKCVTCGGTGMIPLKRKKKAK